MKEEGNQFIQDVSFGRESLSIVLASVQLTEMEKFCTEMMFAVLQIDPTFNLQSWTD